MDIHLLYGNQEPIDVTAGWADIPSYHVSSDIPAQQELIIVEGEYLTLHRPV